MTSHGGTDAYAIIVRETTVMFAGEPQAVDFWVFMYWKKLLEWKSRSRVDRDSCPFLSIYVILFLMELLLPSRAPLCASDISSKGIDFKANSQRDIGNCHPAILAIDYLLLKNSLQNELYAKYHSIMKSVTQISNG